MASFENFSASRPLMLIGCGRMGEAMALSWLNRGLSAAGLVIIDPVGGAPDAVRCWPEIADLPGDVHPLAIVLAIKPQIAGAVLPDLKRFEKDAPLLLSIVAGLRLESLTAQCAKAVRAMPNTPAAIGKGITVAVASAGISPTDRARAQLLLSATGEALWVEDEGLMDAVTALSGSGPAYVFALTEAMAKAGEAAGLPAGIAARLARQTVIGSAALMAHSRQEPQALREQVTSPNGTTAAALSVLLGDAALDKLLKDSVAAATKRSQDLAGH